VPKLYSSEQIVKTLEREGFVFVSQRGSHVKYRKSGSPTLTVIAPAGRKQIPRSTFRSIQRQSGLDESAFGRRLGVWRIASAARRRACRPAGSMRSWIKASSWVSRFATRPELPAICSMFELWTAGFEHRPASP
jgi:predicted RNA binding protein YcfA (HicA-like mRNA interferase family)